MAWDVGRVSLSPPGATQAARLAGGVGLRLHQLQPVLETLPAAPAPPLRPWGRHWAGRSPGPKTGLLGTPSHRCVFPSCRAHLVCTLSCRGLSPRPRLPLQGPESGSTVGRAALSYPPLPAIPSSVDPAARPVALLPPSTSFPLSMGWPVTCTATRALSLPAGLPLLASPPLPILRQRWGLKDKAGLGRLCPDPQGSLTQAPQDYSRVLPDPRTPLGQLAAFLLAHSDTTGPCPQAPASPQPQPPALSCLVPL